MKISTERLRIREIELADAGNIARYAGNIKVSRYLLVVPHPYNMKDAKWWIRKCKKDAMEKPRKNYELSITLKAEPEAGMIGSIGLTKVDLYKGTGTIGYWLGEPYWRQGIMNEAAKALIDFAFKRLKLRRLDVSAAGVNDASNGLIEKLGFVYEGTRRKRTRVKSTGKIYDERIYGMLREEWAKRKN
jgi:RimJ/RimL family protein N-acetyltransferase